MRIATGRCISAQAFRAAVRLWPAWLTALVAAGILTGGCSTTRYRESADEEVFGIIEAKSEEIEGMPSSFSIEDEGEPLPAEQPASATRVFSLKDALRTAVEDSREYQTEKETLYSQGLALSSARHEFNPRFFGTASAMVEGGDGDETVTSILSLGMTKMLATGADLSISITTTLFRVLSGEDPEEVAASAINASLIQPLLRGAGRDVALENLTQTERDMVYGIRDFVRFRKSFSVDIAKSYYNLLEQKDQVRNAWSNYTNLLDDAKRATLMAEAGRLPPFQLDQTNQDVLRARDRWIRTLQSYANVLDEFKIDLGLPTDILIEPDPAELDKVIPFLSTPVATNAGDAIEVALENRLDLKNRQDQVGDAERKVIVAENALKAGLDLILEYEGNTEDDTKVLKFSGGDQRYGAGLDLDLPFDRRFERNVYRQSLINIAAAERDLTEGIDRIKLDVRDAFRNLQRSRESYEIQKTSQALAQRRVDSTIMLQQAGRADTRDVLDAREALVQAQDAVTAALVDYFNASVDLLLATETLTIDDEGFWVREGGTETDESIQ
jgi:outer membrane protein TolC